MAVPSATFYKKFKPLNKTSYSLWLYARERH